MLVAIFGPMKSGKSIELISRAEPFKASGKQVTYIQPKIDTRNNGIVSRLGTRVDAVAVESLYDVPISDVYALDEFHMFEEQSYKYIKEWLRDGSIVFVSTLDTSYDASVFPVILNLLMLKPDEIVLKLAVCDVCNQYKAKYTQILDQNNKPLTKDLPKNLVEDGRYKYEARCNQCFVFDD